MNSKEMSFKPQATWQELKVETKTIGKVNCKVH